MRNVNSLLLMAVFFCVIFSSCDSEVETEQVEEVPAEVLSLIEKAGFSIDGAMVFNDGFLVEGDIYLTLPQLQEMTGPNYLPVSEQYATDNLVSVSGTRNISIYAPEGGSGYDAAMIAGIDEAIARFNAEDLEITFSRVSSSNGADIVMSRLSRRDERRGVLGSAGFPTNSGDPYGTILMSGVLESSYGLSTDGIATIVAHEIGHCIGFRHTDYFDRSISCGGATDDEGEGSYGANHIPGTPTGATYSDLSFMLSCTDGGNRPFNNDDQVALDYLY